MGQSSPLDIITERLQAPGYSYRREGMIAGFLLWSWIVAAFIALFLVTFVLWFFSTRSQGKFRKFEPFLYYLYHIWWLGIFFNIPMFLLFPVIFDYLNVAIGIVFSILISSIGWALVSPRSIWGVLRRKLRPDKYDPESTVKNEKRNFWQKPWKRPFWFWGGLIICFLFGFMLNYFLEDVCIATQPTEINFKVSRRHMDSLCEDERQPCHVYLTFGDQMATAMIVNFHVKRRLKEGVVYFDTKSRNGVTEYRFRASSQNFINMDIEEDRYVYWVELHDLEPNTQYFFRAGGNTDDGEDKSWFSEERWFLTAPQNEPFTYVSGGDMGAFEETAELLAHARDKDPLFIAVGGDLSYASGMLSCYRRWDRWFINWDRHTSKDGRMIPMLLAIGNHEGGYLLSDRDEFPFYFRYFPFEYGVERKDTLDRSSYHLHKFGEEMLLLSLDSAHLNNPKSQEDWIIQTAREHQDYNHKFAFFHIPMWAATTGDPISEIRRSIRQVWQPLFERLRFDIVFQHHDHVYGRTKKMIGEEEFPYSSDLGTVYMNSGCMGVEPVTDRKEDSRYLEIFSKRHFLVVKVKKEEVQIQAIDLDDEVFDDFTVHSDKAGNQKR